MPNNPDNNHKLQIIDGLLAKVDANKLYQQVNEMYEYYIYKMAAEDWTDQQAKEYCSPVFSLTWALMRLANYQEKPVYPEPKLTPIVPMKKPARLRPRGIKRAVPNNPVVDNFPPGMAG